VKINVIKISELRNNAMHLVIPFVPPDIMGLFQAGVINYTKKLQEWFNLSLSDRVTPGMMALTYDIDPSELSLENPRISKRLPTETIKWIKEFQKDINVTKTQLRQGETSQFHIPITFNLAFVRNPKKADIVLSAGGEAAESGIIIEVPKDPDKTHPNRQKEVIERFNKRMEGKVSINPYDCLVIKKIYKVDKRAEWFYQSKIAGHSPQYSDEYIDWLVQQASKNNKFFNKARRKYKEAQSGQK